MVASHLGLPTDLVDLRLKAPASLKGTTLDTLVHICRGLGLQASALKCEAGEIRDLNTPCILHWRFNHFVVLREVNANHVLIHDPARGVVREPFEEVRKAFTGIALEIAATGGLANSRPPRQLRVTDLIPRRAGLGARFVAGLLLALVCECLFLLSPLYLQTVIDSVLVARDETLLRSLLLVFSVLLVFQVGASAMRALTFQHLAHVTVFDMAGRVLRRLLRLPLRYFRDRELGDVQHRFQALARVQSFLVQRAPAMLLDLVFLVLLLFFMAVYDPGLTTLNVVAAAVWVAWRMATQPWRLQLASDITQTESATQTHFLETLRAISSIKSNDGESARGDEWRTMFANTINARIRAGNLQVLDGAVRQCLLQGARIATIFLLAHHGMSGEFTAGMIAAFAAWAGMFGARLNGLVDGVVEYRLLRVPLNRLADIIFAEPEPNADCKRAAKLGDVEIRDVTFRYGNGEAPILQQCSTTFHAGSFIAIAGPSGTGKSTLLSLLAGTDTPSQGDILFDGRPQVAGTLRHRMAMVSQNDCLLRGSVATNIALFDESPDGWALQRAAEQACVAREIERMPMGYETRIGDLGSALSCGQVQRILLARALYRSPELLLLDEATSGLNPELEKRIIQSLASLSCTRIVVTHSDQVLEAADEVWWLHNGTLLSCPPALT